MTLRAVLNRAIYITPALIIIVLGSWALSSPVGSSPDDDFHLTSIWCADGAKEGTCRVYETSEIVGVPPLVKSASDCYKTRPLQSASCQNAIPSESASPNVPTKHFNKGLYPPLYFKVMHRLVGTNVFFAVFNMRLLNVSLFCLLITTIFALGTRSLRVSFAWLWLVCSVPLGVFLIASNNPSSWTIIGIGCLFGALIGYLQTDGRKKVSFAVLVLVCCAIALGSRADAAVYVVVTLIVTAILAKLERPTRTDFDTYFFMLIASVAVLVFFSSNQGQVALESGLGTTEVDREWLSVFWYNLMLLPELWFEGLGIQALGWLDTPMPSTVYIGTCGTFFIIFAANMKGMGARKKSVILFLLFLLITVPLWVLMKSLNVIPEKVQARYLLPLVYLLVGTVTLQNRTCQVYFESTLRLLLVFLLSVSHSVALDANIKRYVTGLDVFGWNLNVNAEWWSQPFLSPMTVWGIASLSFLAVTYILVEFVSVKKSGTAARS